MKNGLKHVVLFAFKNNLTQDKIEAVEEAFADLPAKIDVIQGLDWGRNVGVEDLSQGYTHCFTVSFADEKARDIYLPHPDHREFSNLVEPLLEKVLVFDYYVLR